jgi:signal transduction histidine kinase
VLVNNTDITERKSLEAQIFHAQRLESLGVLAGGIAHDFNNLLTAIIGSAQSAILDLGRDHPARASVWDVERAGRRCADLVRQLLTFSRRSETRRDLTDVRPLVTEAAALLRATLPKRVKLEVRLDDEVPEVIADATQMHQIVMNLGTNAVHAIGSAGGVVNIRLERAVLENELATRAHTLRPGTYTRLVVDDNGSGMDERTLERIFDPFFTTKPTGEGTGLGLSVVHGIVRSHEGGIVVRSTPGSGTELSVYLPAAP